MTIYMTKYNSIDDMIICRAKAQYSIVDIDDIDIDENIDNIDSNDNMQSGETICGGFLAELTTPIFLEAL